MADIVHSSIGASNVNLAATGVTLALPEQANLYICLDESGIVQSGEYLTGWTNPGTRGGTFEPLSESTRPLVVENALNGYPAVKLYKDESGNHRSAVEHIDAEAAFFDLTAAFLVYGEATDSPKYNKFLYGRSSYGNRNQSLIASPVDIGWYLVEGYSTIIRAYNTTYDLADNWHLVVFTHKTAADPRVCRAYVDGSQEGDDVTDVSANYFSKYKMGIGNSNNGNLARCQIVTAMVWDKILDVTALGELYAYINAKYGLSIS